MWIVEQNPLLELTGSCWESLGYIRIVMYQKFQISSPSVEAFNVRGMLIFENQGEPKKPESFLRAVKSIWRIVWSHFGQVRVDFGLPFSLLVRFDMNFIKVSNLFSTTKKTLLAKLLKPF